VINWGPLLACPAVFLGKFTLCTVGQADSGALSQPADNGDVSEEVTERLPRQAFAVPQRLTSSLFSLGPMRLARSARGFSEKLCEIGNLSASPPQSRPHELASAFRPPTDRPYTAPGPRPHQARSASFEVATMALGRRAIETQSVSEGTGCDRVCPSLTLRATMRCVRLDRQRRSNSAAW